MTEQYRMQNNTVQYNREEENRIEEKRREENRREEKRIDQKRREENRIELSEQSLAFNMSNIHSLTCLSPATLSKQLLTYLH